MIELYNRKYMKPSEWMSLHEIICFRDVDILRSVSLLVLYIDAYKFNGKMQNITIETTLLGIDWRSKENDSA
jgi:hypothetical protein